MRNELDELLCAKYPKIFVNRHADMTTTAMCWGFDCGDGWYNIIDALCSQICNHVENHNRNAKWNREQNAIREAALAGNWQPFDDEFKRLYDREYNDYWTEEKRNKLYERNKQSILKSEPRENTEDMPYPVVTQVKEKFGTLRFYMDGYNDKISAYESFAEAMSARTCEDCGSPGKTRYEGWYRTLCDKHAVEQGYEIDLVNLEETDYVPFGAEDKTGE